MKLFIAEQGSGNMRFRYAQLRAESIFLSGLALVEASSAVFRLRKSGSLSQQQAIAVASVLKQELRSNIRVALDPSLLENAARLTEKHSIRSLDAVQLASALQALNIANDPSMQFICSDASLLMCASAEHFRIWNPCD